MLDAEQMASSFRRHFSMEPNTEMEKVSAQFGSKGRSPTWRRFIQPTVLHLSKEVLLQLYCLKDVTRTIG